MIPNYQVRFKNHAGVVTHILAGAGSELGGLSGLRFENVVNGSGSHAIRIRGTNLAVADEIGVDYQVEIWYRPVGSFTWVLVYEGLHRTWVWQADSDGNEEFTSYGSGYNSLLSRRIVAAYSGTSGAEKSGKAETVIKAYVNENAGLGASPERRINGLTIQTDGARGNDWSGSRAWINLLEVCQDIAANGGGDFRVIGTGPALFGFYWYDGQLGSDRSLGNVYGLDPVIFSPQRNNMLIPVLSLNFSQEINVVYVLGQGEGVDRQVVVASNADGMANSPWNRCEIARQATNEITEEGLAEVGAEELFNGQASQSVSFSVAQTPGCAYGIHYTLGDIVTAMYRQRVDKKIMKIEVDVSENNESMRLELADVNK